MKFFVVLITLLISWKPLANPLSYAELHMGELYLLEHLDEDYLMILGQRLIDPNHWRQARRGRFTNGEQRTTSQQFVNDTNRKPWHAYGEHFIENWLLATEEVLRLGSSHQLNINIFKRLHSLVFFGYWGLSMLPYYEPLYEGQYSQEQINNRVRLRRKLMQLLGQEGSHRGALDAVASFDRQRFSVFRGGVQSGYDLYMSNEFDLERARSVPFTGAQRSAYEINPWLTFGHLSDSSVRTLDSQVVFHPQGDQVMESLVQSIEVNLKERIDNLLAQNLAPVSDAYIQQASQIAGELYFDLVSIHAPWDGSGRSARQASHLVLRFLNLPPPRNTPRNDIDMGADQIAEHFYNGILWSQKHLSQIIKRKVPREILHSAKEKLTELNIAQQGFDPMSIPGDVFDKDRIFNLKLGSMSQQSCEDIASQK